MRSKIRRTAVLSAAITCLTFFGAHSSGAAAEINDIDFTFQPAVLEIAGPESFKETDAVDQPRFFSEPVIQELPEPADRAEDANSLEQLVQLMGSEELSGDLLCLAQAIYFEARGEPLTGQLAVGQVIVNRAASSLFPSGYCAVVKQRAQFSFVKNGRIPNVRNGSAAWHRAKTLARIAHDELWDSEVGDALFFHATYVKPGWANQKVARATIDTHIFYR